MLTANVLDTNTTLNNYTVIQSLPFIPGEAVTLYLQLIQPTRADQLRYMTQTGAKLTATFQNTDGTTATATGTVLAGDASIWSIPLTATMTNVLAGGNFTFTLDALGDGTQLIQGWVQAGLALVITGNC